MHFEPNEPYHIYNRGNDRQRIFFSERNYQFFLDKVKNEWLKYASVLSCCLMPNHFHFILLPNEKACEPIPSPQKGIPMQWLSRQIGTTLSSFTKAINRQNETSGNLFQKKTKAKCLHRLPGEAVKPTSVDYLLACLLYIHENPLKAGLVERMSDWKFSSSADYAGFRESGFCNKQKLFDITGLTAQECVSQNRRLDINQLSGQATIVA